MDLAVCVLSSISVLAAPEVSSNRVYELLFGEGIRLLGKENEWVFVQVLHTQIQGWIIQGQFDVVQQLSTSNEIVGLSGGFAVSKKNRRIKLFNGTIIPNHHTLTTGNDVISFSNPGILMFNLGQLSDDSDEMGEFLDEFLMSYLNTPFAYQGRSILGIDAIGLCRIFYRHFGVELPADLDSILQLGNAVDFSSEIKLGDLAFFDDQDSQIIHIGIVLGADEILHVLEKVRIDALDDQGIFNLDLQKYSHKLRIVRRLV